MPAYYFAYGSNMNPERVRARGLAVHGAQAARLMRHRLVFDKIARGTAGIDIRVAHANVVYAPHASVEGVLYELEYADAIGVMDPFERAPINYGRDVVVVDTQEGRLAAWTYFANPAMRRDGLRPERGYLEHLLAGRPYLSPGYYSWLAATPCHDEQRLATAPC